MSGLWLYNLGASTVIFLMAFLNRVEKLNVSNNTRPFDNFFKYTLICFCRDHQ